MCVCMYVCVCVCVCVCTYLLPPCEPVNEILKSMRERTVPQVVTETSDFHTQDVLVEDCCLCVCVCIYMCV